MFCSTWVYNVQTAYKQFFLYRLDTCQIQLVERKLKKELI